MLARWGRLVARRAWSVLLLGLLAFALVAPFARDATKNLSTGGWIGEGTEAFRVDHALAAEFGRRGANDYLLFRDPTGAWLATDPAFQAEVARVLAPLRADPTVQAIYAYGQTSSPSLNALLLSADHRASLAVVALTIDVDQATQQFAAFRAKIRSDRLQVLVGGWPAASTDFTHVTEKDLRLSELVSLPLTLLLLLLVFGGLVAAGLPLLVGGLAIVATLAGIALLSRLTETSLFVVNVATMIGLAIAIDYSLFLVARFREEIGRPGADRADALGVTLAMAGRAVLFSGLTVAVGIAGLAFFPTPALRSIGAGGALVVLLGVGFALTVLPALLALLGPRVDRLRLPLPHRHRPAGEGFWHRLATGVMRRPLWALLPTLAVLLVAGLPFRSFYGGSPGMTMLPRDQESRQLYDAVQADFPEAALSPVYVLLRPKQGAMTDPANLAALKAVGEAIAPRPGVRRVDGLWAYVADLRPDASPAAVAAGLRLRPDWRKEAARFVTDDAAVLEVYMTGDDTAPTHEALVRWLRANRTSLGGGAFDLLVGGGTAVNMELVAGIEERAPLAVGFIILTTYVVLFLLLGSVLLPLKAILMNLLSITASYGALVWVFQEGHLSGLLGFEPLGYTVAVVPVMMFCFVFGLSMDYEVLMLTRIKEEHARTGDNTLAVARGLEATGRLVTSAALIMVVVFGAFGLSRLLLIKSLGIGQALAIAADATLVRALLVPATMRLLGKWNWWAPGRLGRLGGWGHPLQPSPAAGESLLPSLNDAEPTVAGRAGSGSPRISA